MARRLPESTEAKELIARLHADIAARVHVDPEADLRAREEEQAENDRKAMRDRRDAVQLSGIAVADDAMRMIILGDLQETHAYRVVTAWLDVHEGRRRARGNPGRLLILSGGTGCGKTVAAAAAIARMGGRHCHSTTFCKALGSRWQEDRALVSTVVGTRLIVVDDVGTEPDVEQAAAALYYLIDQRQRHPALTIMTTNLPQPELWRRLDARTVSRLGQIGRFVDCVGPDLRLLHVIDTTADDVLPSPPAQQALPGVAHRRIGGGA